MFTDKQRDIVIKRRSYSAILICIFAINFMNPVHLARAEITGDARQGKKIEKQLKYEKRKYKKIKKKQKRDFKNGAWKNKKKDYVNKWIAEEKDYYKKAIKLVEDYLEWKEVRKSKGEKADFKLYQKSRKFSGKEKDILNLYNQKLSTKKTKNKAIRKKRVRGAAGKAKKVAVTKEEEKSMPVQTVAEQKEVDFIYYILSIIAGLTFLGGSFFAARKLRSKTFR